MRALNYGVIRNKAQLSMPGCLVEIHRQIEELIRLHSPEECAVEGLIYVQNTRTAITLGAARGSALLAAAQHGLPIYEYPPRRVKQAVVGRGAAQKAQIGLYGADASGTHRNTRRGCRRRSGHRPDSLSNAQFTALGASRESPSMKIEWLGRIDYQTGLRIQEERLDDCLQRGRRKRDFARARAGLYHRPASR